MSGRGERGLAQWMGSEDGQKQRGKSGVIPAGWWAGGLVARIYGGKLGID